VLARVLGRMRAGDTLVVVRIDRLARSLSHLLEVIEGLEAKGAHFRSLRDPIDTSTPQGKFALQVLGAAAELERALIRERTVSGLRAARARGRVGGNPRLRARDPDAIAEMRRIRDRQHVGALMAGMDAWLPTVRAMRPAASWARVARSLGRTGSPDRPWTAERLARAVRALVAEGVVEKELLRAAAPRRRSGTEDALQVVAAIRGADPGATLRAIGERLREMRIRTPRGGVEWSASSVKMLVDRAKAQGLIPAAE
jgi:hypothetical protein